MCGSQVMPLGVLQWWRSRCLLKAGSTEQPLMLPVGNVRATQCFLLRHFMVENDDKPTLGSVDVSSFFGMMMMTTMMTMMMDDDDDDDDDDERDGDDDDDDCMMMIV
jgi:hypothetical protein